MRRSARVDDNQGAIVAALRGIGATVVSLASVGHGAPDLVCGYKGTNYLLEVKELTGVKGGKSRNGQKLGPAQVEWHEHWRGQVAVVRTIDEAFDAIGIPLHIRGFALAGMSIEQMVEYAIAKIPSARLQAAVRTWWSKPMPGHAIHTRDVLDLCREISAEMAAGVTEEEIFKKCDWLPRVRARSPVAGVCS